MYPTEYINYLIHFHGDRDYFECHEILEEYWKTVDRANKESIWVAFILLSVSNYHYRRNNKIGAKKTLQKALSIFIKQKHQINDLGIDSEVLLEQLKQRLKNIEANEPYQSINLPIYDQLLIHRCRSLCDRLQIRWQQVSDLSNMDIVHRHLRRDRSLVIQERADALKARRLR
ncbi:DUF309 domain-containing protein [Bacillus sp. 03113]|uniref:DUF309 domain-containing protein n=1 Tax=Bacillus sp. 03113 TaxID=2578211 RepID=UPI0011413373|nr:DUF309 domain-containing protein [Bacillus sp. 03113]